KQKTDPSVLSLFGFSHYLFYRRGVPSLPTLNKIWNKVLIGTQKPDEMEAYLNNYIIIEKQ
ncbi:MAG: hypothetical protein KAR17_15925, partial [Cyclobacteriaceae bacterium]|nr:hypothetical protein [Cyclobacteriaceae bacterium]